MELTSRRGFINVVNWICTDDRTKLCIHKGCPVAWACYTDHVEIAKLLVNYGADDKSTDDVYYGQAPLIIATAENGSLHSLKWLVEEMGHDLHVLNSTGRGIVDQIKNCAKIISSKNGLNPEDVDLGPALNACLEWAIEKGATATDPIGRSIAAVTSAMNVNDVQNALKTLGNLIHVENYREMFTEDGAAQVIINVMSTYANDAKVVEYGCGSLGNLASGASAKILKKLSNAGVCEVFLNVLKSSTVDSKIVCFALNGIVGMSFMRDSDEANIGRSDDRIVKKFLNLDGMKIIVQAMKKHLTDKTAMILGCLAVYNLTLIPEGIIKFKLLGSDGYNTIISSLFCLQSSDANAAAESALKILYGFIIESSDSLNAITSTGTRIYEGITTIMKYQSKCPLVQRQGLRLITAIANNPDRAAMFGAHGTCDLIIKAMKSFQNDKILVECCCGTVSNLAIDIDNRNKFVNGGICMLLVVAIRKHDNCPSVVHNGMGAIRNLALDVNTRVLLAKAKACELVIEMMRKHSYNSEVIRKGCQATLYLMIDVPANKNKMKSIGAENVLMLVMQQQHPQTIQFASQALQVMSDI